MVKILLILLAIAVIVVTVGFTLRAIRTYKKLKAEKKMSPENTLESVSDFSDDSDLKRIYVLLRSLYDEQYTIIPNLKLSEVMATENEGLESQKIDFAVFKVGRIPELFLVVNDNGRISEREDSVANAAKLLKCGFLSVDKEESEERIEEKLRRFIK